MRTVKSLKTELSKFPENARCCVDRDISDEGVRIYSGRRQGFVFCRRDKNPKSKPIEPYIRITF